MFFIELCIEVSSKCSNFLGSLLAVCFSCFVLHLILSLENTNFSGLCFNSVLTLCEKDFQVFMS